MLLRNGNFSEGLDNKGITLKNSIFRRPVNVHIFFQYSLFMVFLHLRQNNPFLKPSLEFLNILLYRGGVLGDYFPSEIIPFFLHKLRKIL